MFALVSPAVLAALLAASSVRELPPDAPGHLSPTEAELWQRGRELFTRRWAEPEGLGTPAFNATSCAHCHSAPALGGAGPNDVNVLGLQGRNGYYDREPRDAHELGLSGDVQALLRGVRDHGAAVAGIDASRLVERQAPSLYGLALIDTIHESEIRSNVRHGRRRARDDWIRGRVRTFVVHGRTEIGRFGWKAQAPRLEDFVCMALSGELGVTAPQQGRGFGRSVDADRIADPELTQQDFDALLLFVRELTPPALEPHDVPAGPPEAPGVVRARLQQGEELFEQVGCADCHVPALMGSEGPVPLYSDLLLHRVLRESVGRGRAASFRTPPLWGVRDTAPYLHDGRAPTLRKAIELHAGEAVPTRQRFEALTAEEQRALIAFVASIPPPQPRASRGACVGGDGDGDRDGGVPSTSEAQAVGGAESADACGGLRRKLRAKSPS